MIYNNNQGAITLIKNPIFYSHIKHVNIQYYYVRKTIANNNIKLEYILTDNIMINKLTKTFPINKFSKFRNSIRLKLLNE